MATLIPEEYGGAGLGVTEASAILGVELRPLAKACEEYSATGHTRFAPIALRTNATFIM